MLLRAFEPKHYSVPMKVLINANVYDADTRHIALALREAFATLEPSLSGDYGGVIEHLWIDIELLGYFASSDGKPKHSFRFQKRVSGRSHFGLPATEDSFNVGHYSVRPDFQLLNSMSVDQAVPYLLSLIYKSTELLIEKQKKLGGFHAESFRANFLGGCKKLGYDVASEAL